MKALLCVSFLELVFLSKVFNYNKHLSMKLYCLTFALNKLEEETIKNPQHNKMQCSSGTPPFHPAGWMGSVQFLHGSDLTGRPNLVSRVGTAGSHPATGRREGETQPQKSYVGKRVLA